MDLNADDETALKKIGVLRAQAERGSKEALIELVSLSESKTLSEIGQLAAIKAILDIADGEPTDQ